MSQRDSTQLRLKMDRHNVLLQDKYKALKKQVKMLLHNSKSEHFNQKLNDNKGNTAALWNTLRQLIPAKTNQSCPLKTENGEELQNKANEFKNFFANVGEKNFREVTT